MNAKSTPVVIRHAALALLLGTLLPEVLTVFAQGTAFTYQGRLNDNGVSATGSYDLQFAIYDSTNIPGVLIAGPTTNFATTVSDGLFTVVLDFGDGVFTGPGRWLEIGVRTNGATAFSTLAPRQQLPPVPYAVFAESASNVLGVVSSANLVGSYSSPVAFDNTSNRFSGSFNGDGGGLTNINAVTLGGVSFSNFWRSTGNSGTSPAKGDFLGTTDFQPLELKAGGMRILRLEPDARTNVGGLSGNLIGGYISNVIEQPDSGGDFIGGGGYPAGPNVIHANSQGVFIGAGSANQIGPNVNDAFIGAGYGNRVQAQDGVIGGGTDNTVAPGATHSVIGGGQSNLNSSALFGVIGGGQNNRLLPGASFAVVAGGYANTGTATEASIGGGSQNSVTGPYSSIQGGLLNRIGSNAWYATIGSGSFDSIGTNSSSTTISGGYANAIKDNTLDAAIGGGSYNTIGINAYYSAIAGGRFNSINDNASSAAIAGGFGNSISGGNAVVAGGSANSSTASYAAVGGGSGNTSSGEYATVAGGSTNTAGATNATIGGGGGNLIQSNASYSVVAGGLQNSVKAVAYNANLGGYNTTISGGLANSIGSPYATIGGGSYSSIGTNSNSGTIGGGFGNTIADNTFDSTIGGGSYDSIGSNALASTIGGGTGNSVADNATAATVAGGFGNSVAGAYATALGGANNAAFGNFGLAAGRRAKANHDGTFVWADSTDADFSSTGSNQFLVRASGGVAINTSDPAGVALNVAGTVKATAFQGDGSGLVNVSSGALGNYAFAFTTAQQAATAANTYQDIAFNTAAQVGGWSHAGGTAQFTANQAGLYLVQYTAQAATTSLSGTNVSIRVTLNSVEIPGSQAAVVLSSTSLEVAPLSRSFLATIKAADVLKVQFAGSSTGSRLVGDGVGSTRPSVSLTVTRIQ